MSNQKLKEIANGLQVFAKYKNVSIDAFDEQIQVEIFLPLSLEEKLYLKNNNWKDYMIDRIWIYLMKGIK